MRMTMFVVVLLVASSAFAQSVPPDLQKAMDARTAARLAGDEQTWGRYTTDDFMVVGRDGGSSSKADRMAAIKGNKVTPGKTSESRIRMYGETAIQTSVNEDADGRSRVVSVWVKQGGTWKTAAVQFTPVGKM